MSETIFSNVADTLVYGLLNAPTRPYPFPHFYAENVFPADFYGDIRNHLPSDESFVPIEKTGRFKTQEKRKLDRYVIPVDGDKMDLMPENLQPFWTSLAEVLQGQKLGEALMAKFRPFMENRFGDQLGTTSFAPDILLIRDQSEYFLAPHTDSPHRVLVLILYLPETDEHPDLGTSVYVPKDPEFRCNGGPYHPFEDFHRIFTAPYKPNSAFGFFKTQNSFHGVEPQPIGGPSRNLIHFFIRHQ